MNQRYFVQMSRFPSSTPVNVCRIDNATPTILVCSPQSCQESKRLCFDFSSFYDTGQGHEPTSDM